MRSYTTNELNRTNNFIFVCSLEVPTTIGVFFFVQSLRVVAHGRRNDPQCSEMVCDTNHTYESNGAPQRQRVC